jgi:hypothetical protein
MAKTCTKCGIEKTPDDITRLQAATEFLIKHSEIGVGA